MVKLIGCLSTELYILEIICPLACAPSDYFAVSVVDCAMSRVRVCAASITGYRECCVRAASITEYLECWLFVAGCRAYRVWVAVTLRRSLEASSVITVYYFYYFCYYHYCYNYYYYCYYKWI